MLNHIVDTGIIPAEMKKALVIPLFKGAARNRHENYRLISILPCISQILEKHILQAMFTYLDANNVISNAQYGFIPGKCTQDLLDDIRDLIYSAFEANQIECALFVDVSKVFESVCRSLLLPKLSLTGIRGPFLRLLAILLDYKQS